MQLPAQGMTGDGYRMLQELGVAIVPPLPALTSIELDDACCKVYGVVSELWDRSSWCEGRLAEDIGEIQMVAKGFPVFRYFRSAEEFPASCIKEKNPILNLMLCRIIPKNRLWKNCCAGLRPMELEEVWGCFLDGMLPDKLAKALLQALHKSPGDGAEILQEDRWRNDLADQIKGKKLHIRKVVISTRRRLQPEAWL